MPLCNILSPLTYWRFYQPMTHFDLCPVLHYPSVKKYLFQIVELNLLVYFITEAVSIRDIFCFSMIRTMFTIFLCRMARYAPPPPHIIKEYFTPI